MTASQYGYPINELAAARLHRKLLASEILLWAEKPRLARGLITGTRGFLLDLCLLGVFPTVAIRLALDNTNRANEAAWTIGVLYALFCAWSLLALSAIYLIIWVILLNTPVAYGATKNYALVLRGLFWRRLERAPFSALSNPISKIWQGRRAICLVERNDAKSNLMFPDLKNPDQIENMFRNLIKQARGA